LEVTLASSSFSSPNYASPTHTYIHHHYYGPIKHPVHKLPQWTSTDVKGGKKKSMPSSAGRERRKKKEGIHMCVDEH
jgi:hypothetical protein